MKPLHALLIPVLLLTGCWPIDNDYDFEYDTIITDIPVSLEKLNSAYDDYNSDLPYIAARSEIYFSSNRNTAGGSFDIIFKTFDMSYHEKDDVLNFSFPPNDSGDPYQNKLLPLVNKSGDEFGPFTFHGTQGWDYFFYADDEGDDFDIKFVYTPRLDWGTYNGQQRLFGPLSLDAINSEHDDLYPTVNQEMTRILFCSNRENDLFDIYSAELNTSALPHEYLVNVNSVQIIKEALLSGSSNDKCPAVTKNLLVFTSDRPGGFGGYDLYYSLYTDNKWSAPLNFGGKINSEYDEYRPVTFTFADHDLMIFSSDRPGGKGGYDLYCVKIGDLIE